MHSSLSNHDNLMSMSAYRVGEGRVPTGGEGCGHTQKKACPHTGEKWGVCHRERGVSTDRRGCVQTQRDRCVPTHRWTVNMCFIRMHTALDCAVCGRACVCDSVNMPVSCVLYVKVIDDQAFVSAKLSYNSTKIQLRV